MLALLLSLCTLAQDSGSSDPAPQPAPAPRVEDHWKPLGTDLWFDPEARELILKARVVLRSGPLEHLLCLKQTKEHESILATEAPPRSIQAGLILTGAEAGHPVRFDPAYEPPAGTPIAITIQWHDAQGTLQQAPARDWIREEKSGKPLTLNWVFAGSLMYEDPFSGKTVFGADGGDLITVANFASSILDLPIDSSAANSSLLFIAHEPSIPPLQTEVLLRLRPTTSPGPAPEEPESSPENP